MSQQSTFYFRTPELSHRHELILHLLEYSNHIILVEGEKDSGKTSLFMQLETPDESSLIVRKLAATTHTSGNDILNELVNGEESDVRDEPLAIGDLDQWLKRCNGKQQVPALLIDNIDLFSDELVDYLFNEIISPARENNLHVCLFCEPSFLELARSKGLEDDENRSLHIIEMPYFNEKQTEHYLVQRYPDDDSDLSVFDEKTIKQIHRISHGMPGRINTLAEQYLNDPAEQTPAETVKRHSATAGMFQKNRSIIVVVVLLLLLSTAVAFLLNSAEEIDEPQEIKLALPSQEVDETITTIEPKAEMPVAEIEVMEPEPPSIEELTPPVIPEMAADLALDSEPDVETTIETNVEILPVETEMPDLVAGTPEPQEENEPLPVETEVETQASVTTTEEEPIAANEAPPETAEKAVPEEKPQQTEPVEPSQPQPASSSSRDIAWLLEQNPNDYVIQLIGAREEQTIDDYLRRFSGDKKELIRFATSNDGKPWFVLLYGHFPNRQQAVTTIESLPDQVRKQSPWPRSVKSIQALPIKGLAP